SGHTDRLGAAGPARLPAKSRKRAEPGLARERLREHPWPWITGAGADLYRSLWPQVAGKRPSTLRFSPQECISSAHTRHRLGVFGLRYKGALARATVPNRILT